MHRSAHPSPRLTLALVQLPGRLRRALRLFRKITGLTAVSSLAGCLPEPGKPLALSPPVHPRCARQLRTVIEPPCSEQWLIHLRSSRRSPRTHSHVCPIGLRCTCVAVYLGDQPVGFAKLVVDPDTPEAVLSAATGVLQLVVSGICQESLVSVLSEEVRTLQQRMGNLQQFHSKSKPGAGGSERPASGGGAEGAKAQGAVLVERAAAYLQRHYQDPSLTLPAVARALGCNPRYVTSCFTRIVGERMHTYLVALRVAHSCRLLMDTDLLIKEVAHESGFPAQRRLAQAFQRHVGVSPGEYRRIFGTPRAEPGSATRSLRQRSFPSRSDLLHEDLAFWGRRARSSLRDVSAVLWGSLRKG